MKKLFVLGLFGIAAVQSPLLSHAASNGGHGQAAEAVQATEGTMLFSEDGHEMGVVYRVEDDGSAKLIYNRKMITIPAATLAEVNGRLTTALTKREIYRLTEPQATQ